MARNALPPGRVWNTHTKSPYFDYRDPKTSVMHQLWYDDVESLSLKYRFAKLAKLRGVSMWNADSLDYSNSTQVSVMWGAMKLFSL
jgi:spore germination protein YaaH